MKLGERPLFHPHHKKPSYFKKNVIGQSIPSTRAITPEIAQQVCSLKWIKAIFNCLRICLFFLVCNFISMLLYMHTHLNRKGTEKKGDSE